MIDRPAIRAETFTEFYWVALDFYRVLSSFIEFYWVALDYKRVLWRFTRF